jgi:GTP-binding protein
MATRFIISAAKPEQFPPEAEPEIAFLGRSNVGKSSLLNALMGTSGGDKARVSSSPGRTQQINFYQVDGGFRFVDLPGYGFAKAPPDVSRQWRILIEEYLVGRGALKLAVILVDSRRGWMPKDVDLREWLEERQIPYVVVVTKTDKLKSHKEKHESQNALRQQYSGTWIESSATTGRGMREIWQAIKK